jgi:hypothetical protein
MRALIGDETGGAGSDRAAHLLAQGADGEAVSELAGLPRTASPWFVDELVPKNLADRASPEVPVDEALPRGALPSVCDMLLPAFRVNGEPPRGLCP